MRDGERTDVSTDASGPRFFTRQCIGQVCVGTYFDGTHVFATNLNDTALPRSNESAEALRALRAISSLTFLAPEFAASGGVVEDAQFAMVDGEQYRALVVRQPNAVPVGVYVDPKTALVRFTREVGGSSMFEFRDYRRVGNVMLPFVVLRDGEPVEAYDERAVMAAPFSPPRGLVPSIGSPASPIATDPESTSPVFTCTLAGIETKCLLDTGNSGISMSLELAEQLHAPSIGGFEVHGLGRYATEVVRVGPLLLGNVTFPMADYVVLHDVHRLGYDVILGADVLAATTVEIDYEHHLISFGAPNTIEATSVPLTFENFVPVVAVQVGGVSAQLAVDTGDESNINLSSDFYAQHKDLFSATEARQVNGIGGSSLEYIGQVPSVRIGTISLPDQRVGTTQTLHGTASGHIGAGFLNHFKIIFDYAAGLLQLVQKKP